MRPLRLTHLIALSLATTTACTDSPTDETEDIPALLELENGGYDTEDEAPQFAAADTFTAAAIESGAPFTDALDADPDVAALRARPDVTRLRVAAVWGQMPPDRAAAVAHDWTGRIEVSRGALVVRHRIGFEEATDAVATRTSPTSVEFRSVTRPFVDGLVLEVLTDGDLAGVTLGYTGADGARFQVTLADVLAAPRASTPDADGNRMAVVALRGDRDACDHGFMRGRWHAVQGSMGRFLGQVSDADGLTIGHLRGIYGVRANGEPAFFGKYIDLDGTFRGIFAGSYRDGQFAGRWLTRAGEHGRGGGLYRESVPGPELGGAFVGRWAETSCAADLPLAP